VCNGGWRRRFNGGSRRAIGIDRVGQRVQVDEFHEVEVEIGITALSSS
jgi:hypothetical protein